MSTPERMVQLRCPCCQSLQWTIDFDYRRDLGEELSYNEREYTCPKCKKTSSGYTVLQKSPPEFFLQPHQLYPMSQKDFDHWLGIYREHFPDDPLMKRAYQDWYPYGEERKLAGLPRWLRALSARLRFK